MNIRLTPEQVLDEFPKLRTHFNMREQDFGYFIRCGIVQGYRQQNKHITLVERESVKRLIKYLNESVQEKIIKV